MSRPSDRPAASTAGVRARMSAQAVRDTGPEVALRRELYARGLRYRVCYPVPGMKRRTIDIAFPRWRLAVSVLGCFWHGCTQHKTVPVSNRGWWEEKIERNRERDSETARHLKKQGWTLVIVWEHEGLRSAADRVEKVLRELTQEASRPTATRR